MRRGFRKSGLHSTCPECKAFIHGPVFGEISKDILTANKAEHPDFNMLQLIEVVYMHSKLLIFFYHTQHHDVQLALEAIEMEAEQVDTAETEQQP